MGWDLSNGRDSTLRQMVCVIVQKSDESTKLFERLSGESGKDRSTTQRAKAWLHHARRAKALGCASAGMRGSDQYQAQAADAELKDVDVAEQQPEVPTPMDKTTGEVTTRRAPDLTDPRVQDTCRTGVNGDDCNRRPLHAGFWSEPGDSKYNTMASVSPTRSDHSQR
jgi:hypothetical protein